MGTPKPEPYKRIGAHGYVYEFDGNKGSYEHILICERALGKPLPKGAQVHHVNNVKSDNRPRNLVVCPSSAYHKLLHARTRAYEACGHADWLPCRFCKIHDDPKNMTVQVNGPMRIDYAYHKKCAAQWKLARQRAKGVKPR